MNSMDRNKIESLFNEVNEGFNDFSDEFQGVLTNLNSESFKSLGLAVASLGVVGVGAGYIEGHTNYIDTLMQGSDVVSAHKDFIAAQAAEIVKDGKSLALSYLKGDIDEKMGITTMARGAGLVATGLATTLAAELSASLSSQEKPKERTGISKDFAFGSHSTKPMDENGFRSSSIVSNKDLRGKISDYKSRADNKKDSESSFGMS